MARVILTERIPEDVVEGRRLGRHVEHDSESLRYLFSADLVDSIQSVEHKRQIPVLDQKSLGACTGFAAEGVAGSSPFFEAIPASVPAKPTADVEKDQEQAIALYSAASSLDNVPGDYPPTDTGSTGLAVAKAAQQAGLIAGYQHITSFDAFLKALSVTPLIVGTAWYSGMEQLDSDGVAKVTGSIRGGHEYQAISLDAKKRLIGFVNSWGSGWGVQGRFYIRFDDFDRLLHEQGDATVFVPLTDAPPKPTPEEVDRDMAAAIRKWLEARGL